MILILIIFSLLPFTLSFEQEVEFSFGTSTSIQNIFAYALQTSHQITMIQDSFTKNFIETCGFFGLTVSYDFPLSNVKESVIDREIETFREETNALKLRQVDQTILLMIQE